MKNILIVEDESIVALEIENYVKEMGLNVCAIASSGEKALKNLQNNKVDLVLMDVYLKGEMDGITCADIIRKKYNISVIYISAFSDDATLERAIETNPISYLVKPFNRQELKFTIKIALNRSRRKEDRAMLQKGDLKFDNEFSYDTQNQELYLEGELVHLTKQERMLLDILVRFKNSVVGIYELENYIWPDKESNENTRRALVARLRAKLNYKFLETIHSEGYRLNII